MESGWGSPHGDSNGRAHSRSGSFRQSEKGELSLHPDEKGSPAGLGKRGNAEYFRGKQSGLRRMLTIGELV